MFSVVFKSPARAICVTRNPALRKTLLRTLNAAGSSVEFYDVIDQIEPEKYNSADIIVIDQESASGMSGLIQVFDVDKSGKIIMVGASLEDEEVVRSLRHAPTNHLITDLQAFDERELVITSAKLLSGDIFGLDKYLAWGGQISERQVSGYEEKREALAELIQYATQMGARRHMVAKIESVADELLMNALYDAPFVREEGVSPRTIAAGNVEPSDSALLRYASDGRHFAISVQDNYGELHKDAILDHLTRARAERGRPKMVAGSRSGGAGLGLFFILSAVTRFIANIDPGRRTEVICLFDMRRSGREADGCAQSLHIFST